MVLGADLLRGYPFLQGFGFRGSAVFIRATDVECVVISETAVPVKRMKNGVLV